MKRRILAGLLAYVMLFGCVPATMAVEPESAESTETTAPAETVPVITEENIPEETAPAETTAPVETIQEETTPAETVPETIAEETIPTEVTTPTEDTAPVDTTPTEGTTPVDAAPTEGTAPTEEPVPEEIEAATPEETTPEDSTPSEDTTPTEETIAEATEETGETNPVSGVCGENLTWTLDEAGTLTISGTGDMWDYVDADSREWAGYIGRIQKVTISEGVTGIGDWAFAGFSGMKEAAIPNTVTRIGSHAFDGCESLTALTIPESVTGIGDEAFVGCASLTELTLPAHLTPTEPTEEIMAETSGEAAMNALTADATLIASGTCGENLTWVLKSDGVLSISGSGAMTNYTSSGTTAFAPWYEYRNSIFEVKIESGVTSIGDYAFNYYYPNIKKVSVADTVTYIGDQTFCYCSGITSVNIPNSVTEIDWYAFYGCSNIETIELSPGLSKIAAHVFDSCINLKSILIPEGVTTIDGTAFNNCSNLTTIYGLTGSYAETWANNNGYDFISNGTIDIATGGDDSSTEDTTATLPVNLGTKENPYQVTSAEDFDSVRNDLGAYYVQVCDIDLTGYENWIPIGDSTNAFAGEYDGAGYSISGLNISVTDTSVYTECIGLFGKSTGAIKNICLIDSAIETSVYCANLGSIVGYASSILNCSSNCNIQATCQSGGGIAGYTDYASECKYYGNACYKDGAEYTYSYFGGICGKAGEIIACYNGGTLNSTVNRYYSYLGGIVGYLAGSANQCANSGPVACINNIGGNGSASSYTAFVGGISGLNESNSLVQNSYNCGNIYGKGYSAMVGGISSCGGSGSAYKYCYSKGNLTYSADYPYRGGIIGSACGYGSSYDTQYIYSCYWNNDYVCAGSNVWQPKVIYKDNNYGSLEDAAFVRQEAFVGFDFENIWEFGGGQSYPYPTLKTADYAIINSSHSEGGDVNDSNFSIRGLDVNKKNNRLYIFLGDSHIYNMDSPNAELYLDLNQITVVDEEILTPADITWISSDESVFRIISNGGAEDVCVNLRVEGLSEGTAKLTATNPYGESISLDVTVVKPNELKFTNIYDTKQYYHAGAFYSAASSISDCVEIFIGLENALMEGYPCEAEEDLAHHVDVSPITLTAAVSGSDLSFDRNSYQNTYSATYDAIAFPSSVYDILTLFPVDMDSFQAGSTYTVEVTLESESFVTPIMETYSFTVYDAEKQRVAEHIDFIYNNTYYKVSKQNIYGSDLLALKSDSEYNWSKITSLDFDNYYEIVLADVFIGMFNVSQAETSILPAVLKDWHGTYKTLLGGVTTMVNDSYADILDVSEMKIDKILKVSKYTSERDGIYADDDVYQVVLDMFGNVGNVDKIQSFFAAVDDTKSVFSMVKLTGNLVKDFVVWGNSISVLNAFAQTDDNFKAVCRNIADNIPDSERKMKEAIEDYLNYSRDFAGQFSEIYDSFNRLGKEVTLDIFKGIVGKEFKDWFAATIVGWIGKIPISGGTATLSTTAAYASFTTAIGSVATGFSLGVCLSDFICSSADKATEMSKMIAMSEYAPYIIQTLAHYEQNLFAAADNNAVDLFENAFGMHQAAQSYIMEHAARALQVKADSILQKIRGNKDYNELVAEILVQKKAIDNLKCCGGITGESLVYTTKVIAVKCPVNVYVYNGSGVEIVRIVDDYVELSPAGTVYTRDREKFVALPANQVYSVKIVATDTGTMDYIVFEFDNQLQIHRTVQETDIHLVDGRIFTGEVAAQLDVAETSYELTYEGGITADINVDGTINVDDVFYLAMHISAPGVFAIPWKSADVNGDGAVNVDDVFYLAMHISAPQVFPLFPNR